MAGSLSLSSLQALNENKIYQYPALPQQVFKWGHPFIILELVGIGLFVIIMALLRLLRTRFYLYA